jgi:hypothetical protein
MKNLIHYELVETFQKYFALGGGTGARQSRSRSARNQEIGNCFSNPSFDYTRRKRRSSLRSHRPEAAPAPTAGTVCPFGRKKSFNIFYE